jgi:hypothetical protein
MVAGTGFPSLRTSTSVPSLVSISLLLLTLKMIPIEIQVNQIEVPPILIRGNVCPVTGNK